MEIPSLTEAEDMLSEAEILFPGPWAAHCRSAADNAGRIAGRCGDIDPGAAYIMGLLHDIGRRGGFKHMLHLFHGYDFLLSKGYKDAARICLTHSFPIPDITVYFGEFDCSAEQYEFLKEYLADAEYTDYDRLIQLCDAISLPCGACLMEKRLVDVALRYGLPDFTLRKWRAYFDVKKYFDGKASCNIYDILPNIVENTFDIGNKKGTDQ